MSWRTRIASVLLRYRRRSPYVRARRCAHDWAQLAAAAIRAGRLWQQEAARQLAQDIGG